MHAIYRTEFIVKIREYFSQIHQFISTLRNFFSLNLNEKSMRYAILSKSKHQKLNAQRKTSDGGSAPGDLTSELKG
jgi:hypothetical protein